MTLVPIKRVRRHAGHHIRFYLALAVGLATWSLGGGIAEPLRSLIAGDVLFAVYLIGMGQLAAQLTPARLRQRASIEDEGIGLIAALTLGAIAVSLRAIFLLLNQGEGGNAVTLGLVIASVALGWFMLHTTMAFHYAHRYYRDNDDKARKGKDAGGLAFPQTPEPTMADFLYFSFVVGMTAQVSDVQVLASDLRRVVLGHGVVSFFYNTVLLALAVNVAVNLAE